MSGVAEYNSDNTVLLKIIKPDLDTFLVPSIVKEIRGSGTRLGNPFHSCKDSIREITFGKGSDLTILSKFVFSSTVLQTIDMSECTKLTELPLGTFYDCKKLTTVKLPPNVQEFDTVSFRGCKVLASLKIPDSLTTIGFYTYNSDYEGGVFSYCDALKTLEISETSNLSVIGSYAFFNSGLESIFLPKGFKQLNDGAFTRCKLNTITISNDNKLFRTDGTVIFRENTIVSFACAKTGAYVVPRGVSFLSAAFRSTKLEISFEGDSYDFPENIFQEASFTTITLPSQTTQISVSMFFESKLETIELPSKVTVIKHNAFGDCKSLKTITLPTDLLEINNSVFHGCTALRSIEIPYNVERFGQSVFSGCHKDLVITFLNKDRFKILDNHLLVFNNTAIADYFDQDDNLELNIPSACTTIGSRQFFEARLKTVKFSYGSAESRFESYAFSHSTIQSIEFPSTLTFIGDHCFEYCQSLTSVTFDGSSKLDSISWCCFKDCSLLNTFIFRAKTVKIIEKEAFCYTPKLTTFDISDLQVETIKGNAFYKCGVNTITLPTTIKSLEPRCLTESLAEKIVINGNVEILPTYFASNSANLNSVVFCDSVKVIGSNCFENCPKLETITLGQSITTIEMFAFMNCNAFNSITIPPNSCLTRIMPFAFEGCTNFDHFNIEDKENFKFDYGALLDFNKTKIIYYIPTSKSLRFVVPGTVQIINAYAFQSCNNLYEVIIPDGVIETIGIFAFDNCTNLRHVIVPKSVKTLGEGAFKDCKHLECGSVKIDSSLVSQAEFAGLNAKITQPECITQDYFIKFYFRTCSSRQRMTIFPLLITLFYNI